MKLTATLKGFPVTKFQKVQAIAYNKDGKTIQKIAGTLKICKNAVAEFLKNPDAHGKNLKVLK